MLIHGSTYIFRIYIYIPYTVSMVAVLLYFIHYVHGYMKSFPVFENIIHAHTRIWFFLICKHLTARKLTDNSQEEKPEAAQELWPTLLSPVKTNSTFFRKCVSIRATAYMFFMTTFVKPVWVERLCAGAARKDIVYFFLCFCIFICFCVDGYPTFWPFQMWRNVHLKA